MKAYVPPTLLAKPQSSFFQGKENKPISLQEIENIEKNIENINKQIQDLLNDKPREEEDFQAPGKPASNYPIPPSSQSLQRKFKLL